MYRYEQFDRKSLLYILLSILTSMSIVSCVDNGPKSRWTRAYLANDVSKVVQLTDTTAFPNWKHETDVLINTRKGVKSIGLGGILPETPQDRLEKYQVKIAWNDGTTSCLRIQITQENIVQILDPAYQPCN